MFDASIRRAIHGPLDRVAGGLDFEFVTPNRITAFGFATGMAGALSAWNHLWKVALLLWLISRLADGLDGSLARLRKRREESAPSLAGGYLDIMADFAVYGSFVIGVGHGSGGSLTPFLWVLLGYYLNGTAFLAFSSLGERSNLGLDDGRSLSFIFGLTEGAETIALHSIWCLFPGSAGRVAGIWAGLVLASAAGRSWQGFRLLTVIGNEQTSNGVSLSGPPLTESNNKDI
jgi:phosphatidylglycerophosphate synthase